MKQRTKNKEQFIIVLVMFVAVCLLAGCEQFNSPDEDSSRDSTFDIDSLLIEVYANTTPPTFLGYDTGMTDGYDNSFPVILTSKGYCVTIRTGSTWGPSIKKSYGGQSGADRDQGNSFADPDDWGSMILFNTASNPTANDTPYLLAGRYNRWIANYVFYNPHDGGTYYTFAGASYEQSTLTLPAGFKLYDADGTLCTCNDTTLGALQHSKEDGNFSYLVNNPDEAKFQPLKKIGNYQALGLPNPDVLANGLLYKVKK